MSTWPMPNLFDRSRNFGSRFSDYFYIRPCMVDKNYDGLISNPRPQKFYGCRAFAKLSTRMLALHSMSNRSAWLAQ
jgi:hypothetical protein